MSELTVKQKEFCRLMAEGKCKDQSDAYRKAFKCKMKSTSLRVAASRLMANSNIQLTIKKLSQPVDVRVRRSREDLINLLEDITYHDIGKMYDSFGNPIEPYLLKRPERMSIEGHEFTEDFINVRGGSRKRKNEGGDSQDADTQRMATGYTKKFKHVDRHKYLKTYGQMLGYISDDPPKDPNKANRSIRVTFVSKVENVQVNILNNDSAQNPAISRKLGVSFVKSR